MPRLNVLRAFAETAWNLRLAHKGLEPPAPARLYRLPAAAFHRIGRAKKTFREIFGARHRFRLRCQALFSRPAWASHR